jgi:ubiquinone/menaquinone biosynthesis C-methylase UbiE
VFRPAAVQTRSCLRWLHSLPQANGNFLISAATSFAHDEAAYDAQYGNDPIILDVGLAAIRVYRESGGDFSGPVIEIGCGTGLMSLGILQAAAFPYILLTDPSPAFLDIVRKKLARASLPTDKVGFAVLAGEEMSRLPPGGFALILLRSTLHHIVDVSAFVGDAARALKPGGMMIMEEPCQEGFVLMATIARFFPLVLEHAGKPLTDSQRKTVQLFLDTMKFYSRRDVDKSLAEDKHLFRVDELMKTGERAGLTVEFLPNKTFYDWMPARDGKPRRPSFVKFFRDYLKYSMSFDDELIGLFDDHLARYCDWVEELAQQGNGPYLHGVFVWKKAPRAPPASLVPHARLP